MWFLIVTLFPNTGPLGVLTGHAIALLLYTGLFFRVKIKISRFLKPLLISSVFFSATIFFSLLINQGSQGSNLGLVRYGLVPLYWLFGLFAGIMDMRLFGQRGKSFLFRIAAIFISVQFCVALLQLLGIEGISSILWQAEKARDWTQLVRVVGTVQNPNTLGILSIISIFIFVQNLKKEPVWSKIFIACSVLLIIGTGSRTSLILLFLLPLFHISKAQLFSKKSVYIVSFAFIAVYIAYFLLLEFREYVPYLAQLVDLISGKSINSLSARFSHWEEAREVYFSSSIGQILFGLGPAFFSVMDNTYYYILYNYGIISLVAFVFLIFLLLNIAKREPDKIALRCGFILIICGFIIDSLISFLFMTILFYLIGFNSKVFRGSYVKV